MFSGVAYRGLRGLFFGGAPFFGLDSNSILRSQKCFYPPLDRQKYEKAKSMFYQEMGWDHNGAPTRKTLESFDLQQVANELDQSGLLGND